MLGGVYPSRTERARNTTDGGHPYAVHMFAKKKACGLNGASETYRALLPYLGIDLQLLWPFARSLRLFPPMSCNVTVKKHNVPPDSEEFRKGRCRLEQALQRMHW